MPLPRWEVVARMHLPDGQSWIVPISEGRNYRASRIAARFLAWRFTHRSRRHQPGLGLTWEARPAVAGPPSPCPLPEHAWRVRPNPTADVWVKRATSSGKFTEIKRSGDIFKGVKCE